LVFAVELTVDALNDARQYFQYLNTRSNFSDIGYQWWQRLYDALQTLRTMPERCAPYPPGRGMKTRRRFLMFGSHRIIFVIDVKRATVSVLRILHGARRAQ
jgi:plasmid stabilization system protein ParE